MRITGISACFGRAGLSALPLLLVLAACNQDPGPTTGSLQITVTGLPSGPAAIIVTGPAGFDQSVTATITLSKLAPGTYTITAANVVVSGMTYAPTLAISTFEVAASRTPVPAAVAYATVTGGSIALSIVGLPAGLPASVAVTGPGSFSQTVTGSQTLVNLVAGNYTITANIVAEKTTTYAGTPLSQIIAVDSSTTPAVATETYAAMTGQIDVSVYGTPAGLDPAVLVTGPFGFSHAITTTGPTTLAALPLGTYTLVASSVTDATGTYLPMDASQQITLNTGVLGVGMAVTYTLANPEIAFATSRDGNAEIYVMNGDGSAQADLTRNPASDAAPVWSRDGAKIAFVSQRDGNNEIYTMNRDGSGQKNLSNSSASDLAPAWSPNGTRVAFVSDRDGMPEIYVMNADGSGQTNLTGTVSNNSSPVWSPDGGKIAFVSTRDGNSEIYVMNADGSAAVNLTNDSSADLSPAWSPDGRQIVFVSSRSSGTALWVTNADGTSATRLSSAWMTNLPPVWSPRGDMIAFTAVTHNRCIVTTQTCSAINLVVIRPDGSSGRILTGYRGYVVYRLFSANLSSASWSPDETRVVFSAGGSVLLARTDGSGTSTLANGFAPVWKP